MGDGYIYIWEYKVRGDCLKEFFEAYGPEGQWVTLLRGSPGYLQTELLRDRGNPLRFITIDRWESIEAWQTFRADKASEFETLDKKCESYTVEENQIGAYQPEKAVSRGRPL